MYVSDIKVKNRNIREYILTIQVAYKLQRRTEVQRLEGWEQQRHLHKNEAQG